MTENEYLEMPWRIEDTIENLKTIKEHLIATVLKANLDGKGKQDAKEVEFDFNRAIQALEEIQQYRAIGTIEEFKALKEKSVEKKVNIEQWIDTKCSCGYVFSKHHGDGYHSIPYENKTEHCPRCGQKLGWE